MASPSGIQPINDYTALSSNEARIDAFIDLFPDVDTARTSGSQAGGGFLDEMSPGAAVQIRVEAEALEAALEVGRGDTGGYQYGSYVASADDETATLANIVTGLADFTLANSVVDITRGGVSVKADAVVTKPTAGTLRVADGGTTYDLAAGDVITWAVFA